MKVEHKFAASFAAAFLAVALVGTWACLSARDLLYSNELVTHTHDTLAKLGDLLRSIQGVETGAEGFFLTGEEGYLIPYKAGLEEIGQGIEDLRKQTADDPAQGRNIDALQAQTNRHIAYLHQRVETRRARGLAAVLPMLGLEGKEILDQIRFRAATIRNAELKLLQHREELSRNGARQTFTAFLLLLGLTAAVLLACYAFLRRNLRGRRRTVAALRASERKFRGVAETVSDAVVITNEDGCIQFANARVEKLFGYTAEELAGLAFERLLQKLPAAEDPGGNPRNNAVEGRSMGKRKDQQLFPIEQATSTVATGKEHLTVYSLRDRAELEQGREALARAVAELKHSHIDLDRLAYVAAHDLQTPLRAVIGCIALLLGEYADKLDAAASESIRRAARGAGRLQDLIDDLQTLARVDVHAAGRQDVDCQSVIEHVLSGMKPVLEETGAVVEVPVPLPHVSGGRALLGQLFGNLLDNAIKFRGTASPRVVVTASLQSEKVWRFSVKDNGIGIAPAYFERIFLIFQRSPNVDSLPGTGIGLAVCEKIVTGYGGKLWVESTPGAGADFLFTLPSFRPPPTA